MFNRLLVPLDGSHEAERALPVAAGLARATGGSVTLLRVVRAPAEFEMGMVPPAPWAPADRPEERKEAAAYLESVRTSAGLAGVTTTPCVYAGPAASVILSVARDRDCDLIVMTSHGRTGMKRWLLGSVAAEVAREASVPVLIVRGSNLISRQVEQDAAQDVTQAHALAALVPLDGSALAQAALTPTLHLLAALADRATEAPVAVHLLSVVEPLPFTETAPFGGGVAAEGTMVLTEVDRVMLREAEAYLGATAERLQHEAASILAGHPLRITWTAVWSWDVAHTIASLAATGKGGDDSTDQTRELPPSDLIVMATHGYGGLRRWVMGSVADRVLHATQLPLLIVRPAGSATAPLAGSEVQP